MLINRNGKIIETEKEKIYILKEPSRYRDCKLLQNFVNNFNSLKILTSNKKRVRLKISGFSP
jgi:hypothetical protein